MGGRLNEELLEVKTRITRMTQIYFVKISVISGNITTNCTNDMIGTTIGDN